MSPMATNKWRWAAILLLITAFIGAGYTIYQKRSLPRTQITQASLTEALYGLGMARARQSFDYRLGVSSTLVKAHVSEGQTVNQGEQLIELENGQVVRAPFSGVITNFPFQPGENLFPQITILKLENIKDLFIEVDLEQSGALRVKKGMSAKIGFESLRGQSFAGTVEGIYPHEDTFTVKIKTPPLPEGILPGMSADVAILIGTKENARVLPLKAVAQGKVVVLNGFRKNKVDVQIGLTDDEWAEILSPDFPLGTDFLLSE